MRLILIATMLLLTGCAMTPEQRQAMGSALMGAGNQMTGMYRQSGESWTTQCTNGREIKTVEGLRCPTGYRPR